MPRSKKSTNKPKARTKAPVADVHATDVVIRLDDFTRVNLLRLHAEIDSASTKIKLAQIALSTFIKSVDPEGKIHVWETDIAGLRKRVSDFGTEYQKELTTISDKHNIKMGECNFDEETGIVHSHREMGTLIP